MPAWLDFLKQRFDTLVAVLLFLALLMYILIFVHWNVPSS
jgi:hypothetical protein